LRAWDVRIDEAFFLGGIAKTEILKAFGAHMFFDDKEEYCKLASEKVPTSRVLLPRPDRTEIEVSVRLDAGSVAGQDRFLFICKGYLRRAFTPNEGELKEWYRLSIQDWPGASRSGFLEELEESVKETPRGNERRASTEEDTPKAKLLTFLENLVSKHRPK
jgi:hypothetical protein